MVKVTMVTWHDGMPSMQSEHRLHIILTQSVSLFHFYLRWFEFFTSFTTLFLTCFLPVSPTVHSISSRFLQVKQNMIFNYECKTDIYLIFYFKIYIKYYLKIFIPFFFYFGHFFFRSLLFCFPFPVKI